MIRTKLFRYQRKGVYGLRLFDGRCLLADEMGLGKSIQALTYMHEQECFPTIIVCPASLKWNWEAEIAKHLGMSCDILEGRKPFRINRRSLSRPKIVVINYDILSFWVEWLISLEPQLLVFDEGHYCGNPRSKRTRAVRKLAREIPRVIGLTGTPLINRPAELWPVLNIIRPDLYEYFRPFADLYCAPLLTPWGWQYRGATNLGKLHAELRDRLMIRRLKKQVLKDLPGNRQIIVPVGVSDPERYQTAESDFLNWLAREKGQATARRARHAEELSRWSHLKQLAAELKLPLVLEWIDNFLASSESKLVVFGIHHKMLWPIHARYKKLSVLVDGTVSGRERQRRVDRIQHDRTCRLLVGNVRAAGTGHNMTTPDTVLFAEIPFTPADISQAIARVSRIGQKSNTTSYFLVARDTIEEKLLRLIRRKQQISDSAIDGRGGKRPWNIYDALLEDMTHDSSR